MPLVGMLAARSEEYLDPTEGMPDVKDLPPPKMRGKVHGTWMGHSCLASCCHGCASWQPSHPMRPPWSMGKAVASMTWRCVQRVATHRVRLH